MAAQIRLKMRGRRAYSIDEVYLSDPAEDAEMSLARKELRVIGQRVLKALPVQQLALLIRFSVQEQRPEEIQGALGITETQFRLVKSRGKARFAELCRAAMEREPVHTERRGKSIFAEVA